MRFEPQSVKAQIIPFSQRATICRFLSCFFVVPTDELLVASRQSEKAFPHAFQTEISMFFRFDFN